MLCLYNCYLLTKIFRQNYVGSIFILLISCIVKLIADFGKTYYNDLKVKKNDDGTVCIYYF